MLPEGFRFSQSNLQDYVDCPRRFQLRYVESQVWPGVQIEPVLAHERHMERGVQFHRLVERHQLGMDLDVLSEMAAGDQALLTWWREYLGFDFLHGLAGLRYPEMALLAFVAGAPLVAMFDLVVVVPGERVFIFDWKTYDQTPSRGWFESRLQTRVYFYVIGSSGARVFGDWFSVELVTFVYWVVGDVVMLDYSPVLFVSDGEYLSSLVLEILSLDFGVAWPLAVNDRHCRFCSYRSLCGRGVAAGGLDKVSNKESNIARSGEIFLWGDLEDLGF